MESCRSMNASVPRFSLMPWLLLGMLLAMLFLVARAPASVLQRFVPLGPTLQVSAWGGTVWQGQAAWSQLDASGVLSWKLKPWRMLLGRVQADIRSEGTVPLQGVVSVGWGHLEVDGLQGEMPVSLLQVVLPPGWQMPGVVKAVNFGVARAGWRDGAWRSAAGELTWEGGTLQLPMSGQMLQLTLPPVRITPQLRGDSLQLALVEAASGLALAEATLLPDGQVETQVRERLLRYSPAHRSSGADPDAVVASTRSAG
jgi:general secretion pathway protein N